MYPCEQRDHISAYVSTGQCARPCCTRPRLHHAPMTQSLSLLAMYLAAQPGTHVHRADWHTQASQTHPEESAGPLTAQPELLSHHWLLKKYAPVQNRVPNGKGTCSTLVLSQAPGKKKVPLINVRTERIAFEECTANTQQVLLHLTHKSKAQLILKMSQQLSMLKSLAHAHLGEDNCLKKYFSVVSWKLCLDCS